MLSDLQEETLMLHKNKYETYTQCEKSWSKMVTSDNLKILWQFFSFLSDIIYYYYK